MTRTPRILAVAGSVIAGTTIAAADSQTWNFDLTTHGADVFWTSPTPIDPDAPRYHAAYVLELVEVGIAWNGISFGTVDVTDEIPPEDREGEDVTDGPAPILLLDETLTYPEPPEPLAIQATVRIELDAQGHGQVSITDVTLGTVIVDLGGFIGEQEVDITSVRAAGSVTVTPLGPLGDLNDDGVVDVSDLLILLGAWGPCPRNDHCPADLNSDGVIDVSDLLILLGNWG